MSLGMSEERGGREVAQPSLRVDSIDLSLPEGLLNPHNRRIVSEFLGLTENELPKDLSRAVCTISIGNHFAAIITDAQLSSGKFSCISMRHPKDFGPPLHVHTREDEYFLILEGHYLYQVGDEFREMTPGDLLFAPKGVPHSFRCISEEGATLLFTTPAGFESYFSAVAQLPQEDFKAGIIRLNEQFGIQFVGPPINPAVKFWEGREPSDNPI